MKSHYLMLLAFVCLISTTSLNSQSLACNDHINVSVNGDCAIDLTVDAFLEGDILPANISFYNYQIFHNGLVIITGDINGPTMGGDDMSPYINQTLNFEVSIAGSSNYCWGTMLIEDKIPPAITCDCPVGGNGLGGYDPECSGICTELDVLKNNYWDGLTNQIVPSDPDDIIDDSVEDNCGNVSPYDISYYDVYEDLGACEGTLLRRTWTLQAGNPHGTSCVKEYFFAPLNLARATDARFNNSINGPVPIPILDSLILPKKLVEIPTCGVLSDPASIAAYFDDPTTIDQDSDDNGAKPQQLDVDCVIENNEGIWYAYPHYYINGRNPSGPHAQPIHGDQVCTLITGFSDVPLAACDPGCYGNSKTLRTWTIMDWCTGLFINHEQIIKIVDTQAPVILANDINVSVDPWHCSATVHLPSPEHLLDECDNIVTYWIGQTSSATNVTGNQSTGYKIENLPVGTHQIQYIAQDCCNNLSDIWVTVVVDDNTPPVAISKEFIVTSLTNIGNPNSPDNGISKIRAIDFDNGSYDGCSHTIIEARRLSSPCFPEDTVWGDFVKFCCEDLSGLATTNITVELRVLDASGNTNHTWATVRLEDKSTPTVFCPQSRILTCDMDLDDFGLTGWPDGTSACGDFSFNMTVQDVKDNTENREKPANVPPLYDIDGDGVVDKVPAYNAGCGFGAVRRRFRSNNSIVCEQWFVIESISAFDGSTIDFPDDIAVNCDAYDVGEPTWASSVCGLIGVSVDSDTFVSEPGSCMKILNHWSVIDWCNYNPNDPFAGGRYNHTQIVKIVDIVDPIITVADSLVIPVDLNCEAKGVVLSAKGRDEGDCGSDWLSWEVTIDLYSNWQADYEYGTTQPELINGDPNPFHMPKSANGEEVFIGLPDGIGASKSWHRAVWTTFDGCNNRVSVTRYFQIADIKAPTPYCLNLSTAFMENGEVELWAIDFNVNSIDNCTAGDELLFTFTDTPPPPRNDSEYDSTDDLVWYDGSFWYYNALTGEYEDRDDYGGDNHIWYPGLRSSGRIFTSNDLDAGGRVSVPVYVWDGCVNIDFCTVDLKIVDNAGGGMVAGRIVNETGDVVTDMMTQLDAAMPGYPRYYMSDTNGEYAFEQTPFSIDYKISGSNKDNYLEGVSTLDLVFIQRHILGQELLDSPYKMIAADVTNDKQISALDLIQLRKLILGIYDELPSNVSWKTVDASQNLTISNPWFYNDHIDIQSLDANRMNEDFIAVKIGDVNNSVQLKGNSIEQRSAPVALEFSDRFVKKDEIFEVTFHTSLNSIYGYQFTLDFESLEFISANGDHIYDSNLAIHDNTIAVSCHSERALNQNELLTLRFKAKSNATFSDLITMNSDITRAELYAGSLLQIHELILSNINTEKKFVLYQNKPNPFKENTVISFDLPEKSEVNISFFDVTGKLLHVVKKEFDEGYNAFPISNQSIGTNGMIFYKLETERFTETKHMIILN